MPRLYRSLVVLAAVTIIILSHIYVGPSLLTEGGYILLAVCLALLLTDLPRPLYLAVCGVVLAQVVLMASGSELIVWPFAAVALAGMAFWWSRHHKDTNLKLQQSKAQLDALWETVVDGLIVISERGIIQSVNPAAESIFGYSAEEMEGQNVKMLMPRSYADYHDGYVAAYKMTGEAKIIGTGRDVTGLKKDGTEFPLYLAVNRFEVGNDVFYGGIVRDTTETTKAQEALTHAKECAETANKSKTKFLNSISHEIRTPLNAIMGFAQLFEMGDAKLAPAHRDYLKHILSSGNHLLALINEILDLAQIESGSLKLSLEYIAVQTVMDEALAMVDPLARKHKVTLRNPTKASAAVSIKADRVRLKQALVNLLTNAVKYNRKGGMVTCEIMEGRPGHLAFVVTDTGVGIPDDKQDSIFEPFNRLGREALDIEGTGIGLSVTKTVVDAMGGEVSFTSQVGIGSRFTLEFPLSARSQGAAIKEPAPAIDEVKPPVPDMLQNPLENATILYVEDNPANTALMEQLFQSTDRMNLVCVRTAEEGLAVAQRREVDLILMDLNLPGMDGFEARMELATSEATQHIPVIAVSADVNAKVIQRALNMGFARFIAKPFNLKEAHQTIVSALPGSEQIH